MREPRAPRRALPREPLPTVRPARRMEDVVAEDGCKMSPAACHEFLSRVMYNRRSKGNPLWNSLVLGGFKDGERCAPLPRPPPPPHPRAPPGAAPPRAAR